MSTALERAAIQLKGDLQKYDIKVDRYFITWRNEVRKVPYGTPKQKCLPILRDYIGQAKEIEDFKNDKTVPML